MVYRLARWGATQKEIATLVGVDYKTLRYREWFEETYNDGLNRLKMSLRRKLFLRANEKNCPPAILIFACKNILGMADNPNEPKSDIADDAKRLLAYVREAQRRSGSGDDSGGDADG